MEVAKSKGKLAVLSEKIDGGKKLGGNMGIGHTRWATHGEPSDVNAHPHLSQSGRFAVVHNGIIENYISLKKKLESKGFEHVGSWSFDSASGMIARISANGWRVPRDIDPKTYTPEN